ncbi:MAG TPA: hypothetical protein VND64_18450 [Pirellulales bacterium]|nr:hypothetical protein [Pirellulales bacterium]
MNAAQRLWWDQARSDLAVFIRLRTGQGRKLMAFIQLAIDGFDAYA